MQPPVSYDPQAAVSIRGLVKRFGAKTAVAGLSLDIPVGSFYDLVGPNGAGVLALGTWLGGKLLDARAVGILGTLEEFASLQK